MKSAHGPSVWCEKKNRIQPQIEEHFLSFHCEIKGSGHMQILYQVHLYN